MARVVCYARCMANIELRTPTDDDWAAMMHADGRAFGFTYDAQDREEVPTVIDLSRFRILCDGPDIVGIAGSYPFDVTLPGGSTVPMGGVTWVSVASTHRRRGLLRRLMDACHDDIDGRGEVLATLTASEGGIYERFGYGIASSMRQVRIPTQQAAIAEQHRVPPGSVRFMSDEEAADAVPKLWDRARRQGAGEVTRSAAWHEFDRRRRARPDEGASAAFYLQHADGYACYRVRTNWNLGLPSHDATLLELVASTPEAHVALWQTLLDTDLVGTITRSRMPLDDPLPYLLTNQRAVTTTALNDGIWVNVRDVPAAFGARTYGTDDELVVEVAGDGPSAGRWRIAGDDGGGTCRRVRSRPHLVVPPATLGALLYGGVRASVLAAGRRLTAHDEHVVRRADAFFATSPLPNCQTPY
jgi:predicted acetyltransferase